MDRKLALALALSASSSPALALALVAVGETARSASRLPADPAGPSELESAVWSFGYATESARPDAARALARVSLGVTRLPAGVGESFTTLALAACLCAIGRAVREEKRAA